MKQLESKDYFVQGYSKGNFVSSIEFEKILRS
jgi:hypothetical protein